MALPNVLNLYLCKYFLINVVSDWERGASHRELTAQQKKTRLHRKEVCGSTMPTGANTLKRIMLFVGAIVIFLIIACVIHE